jgi:hypothetical protein
MMTPSLGTGENGQSALSGADAHLVDCCRGAAVLASLAHRSGYLVGAAEGHIMQDKSRPATIAELRAAVEPALALLAGMQLGVFTALGDSFYRDGEAYTESQYRGWMAAAGFVGIERGSMPDGTGMFRGRIPA